MKTILTLFLMTAGLFLTNNLHAQDVKNPIPNKVKNETIPVSPGENWTWVKGHWTWDDGRYVWKQGMYTEIRVGSIWIDGEWERNQKTGWWQYNEGYWQKDTDETDVSNDKNTAEEDKASKEKRQQNKSGGLYIKTGNSK